MSVFFLFQLVQDLEASVTSPDGQRSVSSPSDSSSSGNVFDGSAGDAPSPVDPSNITMDSLAITTAIKSDQGEMMSPALENVGDDTTVKPKLILDGDDHSTSAFDLPTSNGHSQDLEDHFDSKMRTDDDAVEEPGSPTNVTHTSAVGLLPSKNGDKPPKEKSCCTIL